MKNNHNAENMMRVEDAKAELDKAYSMERKRYVEEKISIIETAYVNHQARHVWVTVNEVTGQRKSNERRIRAKSPEERLKLWKNCFEQLLGQPPVLDHQPIKRVFNTLPIETGDFTADGLQKSINALHNNKAPGLGGILIEMWKTGRLDEELLEICNKTFHGDVPGIWLRGGILPFPKKGDLGVTGDYREITLSPAGAKVYNRMILSRICPILDPKLHINQNGFRPGRSMVAQIITLHHMLEGMKHKNLPAVLTFVDFQKAFNSIHRGELMEKLKASGVPEEIVKAIEVLCVNTTAQVLSPEGDTDFSNIYAGVLQGETLAPYLFIMALDYVMQIAIQTPTSYGFTICKSRSRRHPAVVITDTDYADDIALLSDSIEQAELLLHQVESAAKLIGLHINEMKTEYMIFNQDGGEIKSLDEHKLKCVDDFVYFGSRINSCKKDVNTRINKAWAVLQKLEPIWKSISTLPTKLKFKFFHSTVTTVLLYSSCTWTLTKELEKKLDDCYTKMLKVVKNVSWKQHMKNEVLYGEIPKITTAIAAQRVRFREQCWRSKDELAHQLLLWEPTHGKRTCGRPRRTFIDQLVADTELENEDLANMMNDRVLEKESYGCPTAVDPVR